MIAKRLNCSSTASPISACTTRNASACATLTCPAGIGRDRVRSTLASRSRSVMSFQVQPAPRITKAPMKNSTITQRQLADVVRDAGGERRRPPAWHQQQPRSDRPVETGEAQIGPRPGRRARIDPVAGRVGNAGRGVAHRMHGSSRENVAVQRIEGAAALLHRLRLGERCRRAQHFAEAGAGRSARLRLLRHRADLLSASPRCSCGRS